MEADATLIGSWSGNVINAWPIRASYHLGQEDWLRDEWVTESELIWDFARTFYEAVKTIPELLIAILQEQREGQAEIETILGSRAEAERGRAVGT